MKTPGQTSHHIKYSNAKIEQFSHERYVPNTAPEAYRVVSEARLSSYCFVWKMLSVTTYGYKAYVVRPLSCSSSTSSSKRCNICSYERNVLLFTQLFLVQVSLSNPSASTMVTLTRAYLGNLPSTRSLCLIIILHNLHFFLFFLAPSLVCLL